MQLKTTLRHLALGALVLAPTLTGCQSTDADPGPAMSPEEVEALMMELATPGEAHSHLEYLIGDWLCTSTMTMDPEQQPLESEGSARSEWALGGRFVQTTFTGSFQGMPFEGIGFVGYDNSTEQYEGFWIDNMGTMMLPLSKGSLNEEGNIFTMERPYDDPSGAWTKMVDRTTIHGPDHHTFEMFFADDNGNEYKTLNIEYRRR